MRRKRPTSFTHDLQAQDAINLTPLIDVVFVVLILFILIAPSALQQKTHSKEWVCRLTKPQLKATVARLPYPITLQGLRFEALRPTLSK